MFHSDSSLTLLPATYRLLIFYTNEISRNRHQISPKRENVMVWRRAGMRRPQ